MFKISGFEKLLISTKLSRDILFHFPIASVTKFYTFSLSIQNTFILSQFLLLPAIISFVCPRSVSHQRPAVLSSCFWPADIQRSPWCPAFTHIIQHEHVCSFPFSRQGSNHGFWGERHECWEGHYSAHCKHIGIFLLVNTSFESTVIRNIGVKISFQREVLPVQTHYLDMLWLEWGRGPPLVPLLCCIILPETLYKWCS